MVPDNTEAAATTGLIP